MNPQWVVWEKISPPLLTKALRAVGSRPKRIATTAQDQDALTPECSSYKFGVEVLGNLFDLPVDYFVDQAIVLL